MATYHGGEVSASHFFEGVTTMETEVLGQSGHKLDQNGRQEHGAGENEFAGKEQYPVFIAYNGVEKTILANERETVQALLNGAIQEFHITTQPHVLSLYNQAGVELPDAAKVGEVGIRPKDHLLLRPGAVKGGAR
jgi:hypothetical protein